MGEKIERALKEVLVALGASDAAFVVERPGDLSHGDYMTNAALVAAKRLGKNPRELADELAGTLSQALGDTARDVSVAGPGFVNITLSRGSVALSIAEAVAQGDAWGRGNSKEGKRVMLEYTDPNPFKEMHIGHLMSNVIGEALSRLVANEGAHVIRACYQGDVGPQVAKALWGLREAGVTEPATAKKLGDAYAAGARAYEEDEEAKRVIDELNVAIYEGRDPALMELWRKGRAVSLDAFEALYRILGTHFDYYFFESETAEPGMRIVRDGLARGIFEESEGAVIYRGEKQGLHTLVFITSKGTPTYETKDIGLAFLKEERAQTDESIIITAAEQIGHFMVFLAALSEIAPTLAKKTHHVPHGFLRLVAGKMSSREGNVVTADGLIDDMIAEAVKKNPDPLIAEQVAVGAIKFMILRQSPGQDIIFDPEKSLSLEGDSGPYLQYSLVRARSVLAKAPSVPMDGQGESSDSRLARLIVHYPEVVERAAREQTPNLLVTYLLELAAVWNSFYAHERILGSADEAEALALVKAFAQTMHNGLTLLGIPTPERM